MRDNARAILNEDFLRGIMEKVGDIREERAAYGPLNETMRKRRQREIAKLSNDLDLDGLYRLLFSLTTVDIDVMEQIIKDWRRREVEAQTVRFEYEAPGWGAD